MEPVPAEPTTTSRSPQLVAPSAAVDPSGPLPVGDGNTVRDQVVAFGEVHTVASALPVALSWVPAMSQTPPASGATKADSELVLPPPSAMG